jgi:hypothetical protein
MKGVECDVDEIYRSSYLRQIAGQDSYRGLVSPTDSPTISAMTVCSINRTKPKMKSFCQGQKQSG